MPRTCHEAHSELERVLGNDAAVSWGSMGDKARKQLGWGIRQHPAATTAPRKFSRIIVRYSKLKVTGNYKKVDYELSRYETARLEVLAGEWEGRRLWGPCKRHAVHAPRAKKLAKTSCNNRGRCGHIGRHKPVNKPGIVHVLPNADQDVSLNCDRFPSRSRHDLRKR